VNSANPIAYFDIEAEEQELVTLAEAQPAGVPPPPFVVIRLTPYLERDVLLRGFTSHAYPARVVYGRKTSGLWVLLPFATDPERQNFFERIIDYNKNHVQLTPHPGWWALGESIPTSN
jgi:hypothetical protein